MFCSFCGTQIPNNSTTCPNCGSTIIQNGSTDTTVVNPINNYEMQKNAVRASEIKSLTDTITYFEQIKDKFIAYDEASAMMQYYSIPPRKAPFIIAGILIFAIIFTIWSMFKFNTYYYATLLISLQIFGIPAAILICYGIFKRKKTKKKYKHWESVYLQLANEIYDHYNAYPSCPVGMEYINPNILHNIMQILRSGRADTIKESLNVAVADAGAAQIQQYLSDMKDKIEQIEAETTIAAVFAAGSFFK